MVGSLFSYASVCSVDNMLCCLAVSRPNPQAIEIFNELLESGKINPQVSRFMAEESVIQHNDIAAYQVIFDHPSIPQPESNLEFHKFFNYFRQDVRNMISTRCIPIYGLSLDAILEDPEIQSFGASVKRLFIYTERLVSYRTDFVTFIAWHD
ncbi:MAG: hypothetical protein LBL49_10675 [Clostridiales Family XIII bacterium]|jgi:hypothetical protein|nr:hypothetical protein [Clostridiales Family XIII bacterium]